VKKSVLLLSSCLASGLLANAFIINGEKVLEQHPLNPSYRAVESGGSTAAIDTYSDGVGVQVATFGDNKYVDNVSMNKLVYEFGEDAKVNNTSLGDQVLFGEANPTEEEIAYANDLKSRISTNGSWCDDHDDTTAKDTIVNGICIGMEVSYNNSCSTGYGVDYPGTISCIAYDSMVELDEGWLNLKSVTGNLYLEANALENVDNLRNLSYVSGVLGLRSNFGLTNVNGLTGLTGVGTLYFSGLSSLTDISGLSNLRTANVIDLYGTNVTDLSPLNGIISIANFIKFENKAYSVKLAADSYICQNFELKVKDSSGNLMTAADKPNICAF
jgi:hypothetical protein